MLFSTRAETDLVDLSLLKCRQKDQLQEAFKSWCCDVPCNSEWGRTYMVCGEKTLWRIALEVCLALKVHTSSVEGAFSLDTAYCIPSDQGES